MDKEKVLEEYQNGDDGKRLSLFLTYRELREQFWRIEANSLHEDLTIFKCPWRRKRSIHHAA